MRFRIPATLIAAALGIGLAASASAQGLIESPLLEEAVKVGELPPIQERIPDEPLIVSFAGTDGAPGIHGGDINMLIPRERYLRHMVVYSYARLVGYNEEYELEPDLVRDLEVVEGRSFTFHLRRGHKWSDGAPFTADDFRYWWEDVVLNEELNPGGIPSYMLVDGAPPIVEFPDAHTVRYTWPKPNPYFLPRIAGASPLFIYRPAHTCAGFMSGTPIRRSLRRPWKTVGGRAGLRCTTGVTACTGSTTSSSRPCSPGRTRPRTSRQAAMSDCATRSITRSTRTVVSCPMSTASS